MQVIRNKVGYACCHQLVCPFCATKRFQACSQSYGTHTEFSTLQLFYYLSALVAFEALSP